jgi:hypothetical protein
MSAGPRAASRLGAGGNALADRALRCDGRGLVRGPA